MNAIGFVAEFNPFTNGHQYFIKELKKNGQPLVAVMSGSYVQRGEPAFANKFLRAKTAILGGADLILELPCAWVLRSAEYFAKGGISILRATGVVDTIACGAEHPDLDFREMAGQIPLLREDIIKLMQTGLSYPRALQKLIPRLPSSPNDILALEYTKYARDMQMLYIPRNSGYHEETLHPLASASAVRKAWPRVIQAVPETTMEILLNRCVYDPNIYWRLVQYRLRMLSPAEIANATTATEGLENLLKKSQNALTLQEALDKCSGKRYPTSRIRRLMAQLSLCQERPMWELDTPEYIRILAFNNRGRELLREMKQKSALPIITKPDTLYGADVAATDVLASLQNQPVGLDFTTSPVYIK